MDHQDLRGVDTAGVVSNLPPDAARGVARAVYAAQGLAQGGRVVAEVLVARGRDLIVKCPWCAAHHRHLRDRSRVGWQHRTPPCGRVLSEGERAVGYWFLDDGRS